MSDRVAAAKDERDLVRRVINGDDEAFRDIMLECQPAASRAIFSVLGGSQDIPDILQESFLLVYRKLHRFGFESSLKTWVVRISINCAVTHLRKKRKQFLDEITIQRLIDESDIYHSPPDVASASIVSERLKTVISELPSMQASIVKMFYYEDMSVLDISEATGVAVGTIKSHLHRARHLMSKRLTHGDQSLAEEYL